MAQQFDPGQAPVVQRGFLPRPVLLWALAAVVLVLGAVFLVAGPGLPFRNESNEPETASTGSSYTEQGLTISVVSAEATVLEIRVVLAVTGREDLGNHVVKRGLATLIGDDGRPVMELGGSVDGRQLTLRFPASAFDPASGGEKALQLRIERLGLAQSFEGARTAAPLIAAATLVANVSLANGEVVSLTTTDPSAGPFRLESVERSAAGVFVRGLIVGIPREQLRGMRLDAVAGYEPSNVGRLGTPRLARVVIGDDGDTFEVAFSGTEVPISLALRLVPETAGTPTGPFWWATSPVDGEYRANFPLMPE